MCWGNAIDDKIRLAPLFLLNDNMRNGGRFLDLLRWGGSLVLNTSMNFASELNS